jgi:hypothetical protein
MTESTAELTVYILLPELSRLTGLPRTYLKKLTDTGQLPYLDSGRHRHYNVEDVTVALSKLAHARMPQITESPIDFREFSTRAAKVLKLLRVTTWEQLVALPKEQLAGAPNIGPHTLTQIEQKLAARQQQGSLFAPATYDGDEGT